MELPKKYKVKEIEDKWKESWIKNDTFIDNSNDKKVFSVDTPPPTVSGKMHMGHAFSYTQGDFIARFKRMSGFRVFYPFGTDDNGLPTEHLIEKKKKVRSTSMSRGDFVELCHKTIQEIKPNFMQAWMNLGVSCDYKNSYSTIDKRSTAVSQKSFLNLYNKGLVTREEKPTVWCTKCQTAIAQAEFENIEKKSTFNDIAFLDEEGNDLIIATTRPELLPACVGLFANPKDRRYTHLKGKKASVPLFNYTVPILYDEAVEFDKGTGLMMVCTFGDKEDVEKWHKHKLQLRVVLTKNGRVNELAGKYNGMKILEAREAIIEDLKGIDALKGQKDIVHNVNVHDRCGTGIEFQKTPQWSINVMDHKEKLLEAGDKINWYPEHMKVRYTNWVKNLGWNWGISRQRHFGVPFPVWYEKDTGNVIVAKEEDLPIDPAISVPKSYTKDASNLIAEPDVMDTWATSSVSPQIALNWANKTDEEIAKEVPMTIRFQSHDIIRTWAFYTITKSMFHHNVIPWKNIMVSGFVLDSKGKKMSKSKGNTIDPLDYLEKFGADSMRYAAASVKLGDDIPFQEKYILTGKKTATKIFNAAKFVHMHLEDYDTKFDYSKLEPIDKWIISKLQATIKQTTEALNVYEFSKARALVENFFWHVLCDNYLEMVKDRLYKPEVYGEASRLVGQMTVYAVLRDVLKLFAPYMPFVTEEAYSWFFAAHEGDESLHTSSWPIADETMISSEADQAGEFACDVVSLVRKFKSEKQVSQKHEVDKLVIKCLNKTIDLLKTVEDTLKVTLSAKEIVFEESFAEDIDVDVTLKALEVAEE